MKGGVQGRYDGLCISLLYRFGKPLNILFDSNLVANVIIVWLVLSFSLSFASFFYFFLTVFYSLRLFSNTIKFNSPKVDCRCFGCACGCYNIIKKIYVYIVYCVSCASGEYETITLHHVRWTLWTNWTDFGSDSGTQNIFDRNFRMKNWYSSHSHRDDNIDKENSKECWARITQTLN